MSVQVRPGRWRTRGGDVVVVQRASPNESPYQWVSAPWGTYYTWTNSGQFVVNGADTAHDLIEYLGETEAPAPAASEPAISDAAWAATGAKLGLDRAIHEQSSDRQGLVLRTREEWEAAQERSRDRREQDCVVSDLCNESRELRAELAAKDAEIAGLRALVAHRERQEDEALAEAAALRTERLRKGVKDAARDDERGCLHRGSDSNVGRHMDRGLLDWKRSDVFLTPNLLNPRLGMGDAGKIR